MGLGRRGMTLKKRTPKKIRPGGDPSEPNALVHRHGLMKSIVPPVAINPPVIIAAIEMSLNRNESAPIRDKPGGVAGCGR
jgi:hypothetical protein